MSETKKSVRLEIPGVTDRKTGKPQRVVPAGYGADDSSDDSYSSEESIHRVVAEDKLRLTINPRQKAPVNSVLQGTIHAAEERARLYEDMKSKMARRKTLKNLFDILVLLALLAAIVGGYITWSDHKAKVEAEKTRLRMEEEAENVRLDTERQRLEAERQERLRKEREAYEQRKREERLAEEAAKRERRDNAERYQMFKLALKENEFDLFTKSVTNDLQTTGGELCYLLATQKFPAPFHWVVYSTNGGVNVFRLEESGNKEEIGMDMFRSMLAGTEYIVAKDNKVYFRSSRKKPGIGKLDKSQAGDPAAVFWGQMTETMKWLRPTYDELTFDIFFTPKDDPKKKIKVENVLFGCEYSLQNVYDAIENAYPFNASNDSSGRSGRRFKRTVKLWNGLTIRKGTDGITYVPMSPPPQRPSYTKTSTSYGSLSGYRTIYTSRVRSYANDSGPTWQTLYERALQEDAEERAFYENRRNGDREARASAISNAERKWRDKIETIFREGSLSFGIRKAKVD